MDRNGAADPRRSRTVLKSVSYMWIHDFYLSVKVMYSHMTYVQCTYVHKNADVLRMILLFFTSHILQCPVLLSRHMYVVLFIQKEKSITSKCQEIQREIHSERLKASCPETGSWSIWLISQEWEAAMDFFSHSQQTFALPVDQLQPARWDITP